MFTRRHLAVVVLLVTFVTAAPALAQQGASSRRPYRGLFGSPSSPDAPQSLVLSGSVFGAYYNNVVDGIPDPTAQTPWLQGSGHYQGAQVGLDYAISRVGRRFSVAGSASGGLTYYRSQNRSRVRPSNNVALTVGARLSRTTSLSVRQSAAYTSNYNQPLASRLGYGIAQDLGVADDDALDLFELRAFRMASTVALSQSLGRYLSIGGAYSYRWVEILDDDPAASRFKDYRSHAGSASIQYARPVTRSATMVLGYGIRATESGSLTGDPSVVHNVNAGINYGRALSFSRRTSLSFSTGSAIATTERIDVPGADKHTRIYLVGDAALTHELGRTWTASVSYTRGLRTMDGLDDLYFTQAVRGVLGGLVSRRLSVSSTISWADSTLENQGGGRHRGYAAGANAQYALTRALALYTSYTYFHYRFNDGVVIDRRLPRQLDRHGVRAGLTTAIPLIR